MGVLDEISWFLSPNLWRQDEPDGHAPLKYDPQFGFDQPREEKKIIATKEEMDSCNLPPESRNICAHINIQWRNCIVTNMPLYYRCQGLKKELTNCYWEDRINEMKEFEREKRLNARERKLSQS